MRGGNDSLLCALRRRQWRSWRKSSVVLVKLRLFLFGQSNKFQIFKEERKKFSVIFSQNPILLGHYEWSWILLSLLLRHHLLSGWKPDHFCVWYSVLKLYNLLVFKCDVLKWVWVLYPVIGYTEFHTVFRYFIGLRSSSSSAAAAPATRYKTF